MSDNKIRCKFYRFQEDGDELRLAKSDTYKSCEHDVRVLDEGGKTDRGNPLQYAVALMGNNNVVNDVVIPDYANNQRTVLQYVSVKSASAKSYTVSDVQQRIDNGTGRKVALCVDHWFLVRQNRFNEDAAYPSQSVHGRTSSGGHI